MSERAFLRRVLVKARPDEVFDAIATLDGLRGWWTPLVEGSTSSGGDLRFEFEGLDQHIMMHVDASHQSTLVRWTCGQAHRPSRVGRDQDRLVDSAAP